VEEERRLMYVAVTRAKRRLYVTHAQSRMLHGQVRYNIASRFLDELPRRSRVVALAAPAAPRRRRHRYVRMGRSVPRSSRRRARRQRRACPMRATAAPRGESARSVRHAKFGVGIIVDAEGRGGDARVQVNFRNSGVKWLALEYAKLEAA
jgi:DNA helicase-2/ATP-dependent DNA helicase PcrA